MTGKLSSVGSSACLELIKKVVCGNIMLDHIFHAYYFFFNILPQGTLRAH